MRKYEDELIKKADDRQTWLGYGVLLGFLVAAVVAMLS